MKPIPPSLRGRTVAAVVALCAALPAGAQVRPPRQQPAASWTATRIDPRAAMLFAHRARTGATHAMFRANADFERSGALPVVVRFAAPPAQATLAALAARGVAWQRGGRPILSGAYLAAVGDRALAALEREPAVVHVEVDLMPDGPLPLHEAAREITVDAARRALRAVDGAALDGRGVVIGDIDTDVFVFHPALFHADAGVYPWLDVDGSFTPGTDAVDLDRDGAATPEEVLQVLEAPVNDPSMVLPPEPSAMPPRPDRDWLYVDTNHNAQRDYGRDFDEATPAYGEPLFVIDDANGDGVLGPTERLLRLGTSKIRGVNSNGEFARGGGEGRRPLIEHFAVPSRTTEAAQHHATGVAGILVGGVPGVTQFLGVAPGAELLVGNHYTGTVGRTALVQWALDRGANVLLTEMSALAGLELDGSTELELLLDGAVAHNVVVVSPAGNFAGAEKHAHVRIAATGETVVSTHSTPAFARATLVILSVHHRSPERGLGFVLTPPSGVPIVLEEATMSDLTLPDGSSLSFYTTVTSRGTLESDVVIQRAGGVAQGVYRLTLSLRGTGGDVDADVYNQDNVSEADVGLAFDTPDPTRTIGWPANSDRTIAVAAYRFHASSMMSGPVGALLGYSSRGPRIDGDPGMDIAAPTSAFTIVAPNSAGSYGGYRTFGGTSGAGPFVAGAAALLRQRFPTETAEAVRARLVDHARHDAFATPAAATAWGQGKLDVAAALGVTPPADDGRAPTVTLLVPARVAPGAGARAELTVDDDEPRAALRARWDTDYDGRYDTEWVALDNVPAITTPAPGVVGVRVEVRDGQGHLAVATARIEVAVDAPLVDAGADAGVDGSADGGGGGGGGGGGCACKAGATPQRAPAVGLAWLFGAFVLGAHCRRRARA